MTNFEDVLRKGALSGIRGYETGGRHDSPEALLKLAQQLATVPLDKAKTKFIAKLVRNLEHDNTISRRQELKLKDMWGKAFAK